MLSLLPGMLLDPVVIALALLAAMLAWDARDAARKSRPPRRAFAALGLLWITASPVFSGWMTRMVAAEPAEPARALAGVPEAETAMVVLAGGQRTDEPTVPPSERLTGATVQRVIGAARLYREMPVGLVLVSGGAGDVGDGMRELLVLLGVPEARIEVERRSIDTKENAELASGILEARRIRVALLVTSATHLPRAVREFERAGREVVPAPVDFSMHRRLRPSSFLPSSSALLETHIALHELLGRLEP